MVAQGYPHVYMHFLANVVRAGLQRYGIPFPAPSRLAHDFLARLKGASPDLVHIDDAHEYADAAEDIKMWWSLLRPGGVMLGDDFQHAWAGVVRAACEHAARCGLVLRRPRQRGCPAGTAQGRCYVQKKWWLQKPASDAPSLPARGDDWVSACTAERGWTPAKDDPGTLVVDHPRGTSR